MDVNDRTLTGRRGYLYPITNCGSGTVEPIEKISIVCVKNPNPYSNLADL